MEKREGFVVMEASYSSILVVVTQLHVLTKIHIKVYLKSMNFTVG